MAAPPVAMLRALLALGSLLALAGAAASQHLRAVGAHQHRVVAAGVDTGVDADVDVDVGVAKAKGKGIEKGAGVGAGVQKEKGEGGGVGVGVEKDAGVGIEIKEKEVKEMTASEKKEMERIAAEEKQKEIDQVYGFAKEEHKNDVFLENKGVDIYMGIGHGMEKGVDWVTPQGKQTWWDTGLRINGENPHACQCMKWKEVMTSKVQDCGHGFEFTHLAMNTFMALPDTAREFLYGVNRPENYTATMKVPGVRQHCDKFAQINDNACARIQPWSFPGKWYDKHWCYVSDECDVEYHPEAVSTWFYMESANLFRIKICDPKKDNIIDIDTDEKANGYAKFMGVDPDFLKITFRKTGYPPNPNFTSQFNKYMPGGWDYY